MSQVPRFLYSMGALQFFMGWQSVHPYSLSVERFPGEGIDLAGCR